MSDEERAAREQSTRRARRAGIYDSGSWSASVTAVGAGVVAFLCWLVFALRVGDTARLRGPGALLLVDLAVAVAATAVCAAFAAAYLVLRTIQRDVESDDAG